MNRSKYLLVILSLLLCGCARKQAESPEAGPSLQIYDDRADARADIAAAVAKAGETNRNVVLIFGADW